MSANATSRSSAWACTRGASGATTSPSTAWSRRGAALADAGLEWTDIQYVAGADTIRNGYPGFIAGATFAQKLGWTGVRVSSSYAACASGAQALHNARAQILAGFCDVALVVGADTTPKGFFAPVGGERTNDPDWLRFRLLGATNPTYFALYARRRMDLYGATSDDFALVKVKNSRHGLENPNARFRKENSADDVLASPVVADPLRLLDICATSDGGAAMIVSSMDFAAQPSRRRRRRSARQGRVDGHAALPADRARAARLRHRLERGGARRPTAASATRSRGARTKKPASGPTTSAWPRSTTCPPRSSSTGTRTSGCAARARPRRCCARARPTVGGRIPVNPSGGLACFGEAIPAQAIAQVCEVTWQLRGEAERPPGRGRDRRRHRQPGTLRSRLVRDRQQVER